jgi:alpha-glucosidase
MNSIPTQARRFCRTLALVAMIAALGAPAAARPQRSAGASPDWWKHAVFYELYVRSFQDSNGDGVGDLNGITSRLDYLQRIGVDAIWLTPFFPSPQVDFGYDVSDYENVDPQFGTLADFDRLVAEAHKRGLKIVCDYVMNHTSDKHPWFVESRSSRDNPKADWYVWRDPKPGGGPPNNWLSIFGGSAWTLDEKRGQYYYHFFYKEQPDVNWRNPQAAAAMLDAMRFWYRRGVDGFRVDAIDHVFEDKALRDNPLTGKMRADGTPAQSYLYTAQVDENHDAFRRVRQVSDEFPGTVTMGETGAPPAKLRAYYGKNGPEFHLPFNFALMNQKKLDASGFRAIVAEIERALGDRPVNYVLSNHDRPRSWDLFGDGVHNDEIAKLLAMMLLTLRGVPFVYYGEEIGMKTTTPERIEDVRDPVGRTLWPEDKGRDGERTPMQWSPGRNAGFSTAEKTWLPVPPTAATRNVEIEEADPTSVLAFFKRAVAMRRASPALLEGTYRAIGDDPSVFAYRRDARGQTVVVALNMSGAPRSVELKAAGVRPGAKVLLSSLSGGAAEVAGPMLELRPYEAVAIELPRR